MKYFNVLIFILSLGCAFVVHAEDKSAAPGVASWIEKQIVPLNSDVTNQDKQISRSDYIKYTEDALSAANYMTMAYTTEEKIRMFESARRQGLDLSQEPGKKTAQNWILKSLEWYTSPTCRVFETALISEKSGDESLKLMKALAGSGSVKNLRCGPNTFDVVIQEILNSDVPETTAPSMDPDNQQDHHNNEVAVNTYRDNLSKILFKYQTESGKTSVASRPQSNDTAAALSYKDPNVELVFGSGVLGCEQVNTINEISRAIEIYNKSPHKPAVHQFIEGRGPKRCQFDLRFRSSKPIEKKTQKNIETFVYEKLPAKLPDKALK